MNEFTQEQLHDLWSAAVFSNSPDHVECVELLEALAAETGPPPSGLIASDTYLFEVAVSRSRHPETLRWLDEVGVDTCGGVSEVWARSKNVSSFEELAALNRWPGVEQEALAIHSACDGH